MSHLSTVQTIYAAFMKGDVPTILDRLADDVDWEYGASPNAAPWLQPRRGKAGAKEFFVSLGDMQINSFLPKTLLAGEEAGRGVVVALIDIDFTVKSTGKHVFEEDEIHIWRFDAEGKVARFRHRADTKLQGEACTR
jgi:ketosteroid isomerase-like protein